MSHCFTSIVLSSHCDASIVFFAVQPIWCDGKIGETGKQNDACLNCGGDGRGCTTKHGIIDTKDLPLGIISLTYSTV